VREKFERKIDQYDVIDIQKGSPTEMQFTFFEELENEKKRLLFKTKQICLLSDSAMATMNVIQKAMRMMLHKYGLPLPTPKEYIQSLENNVWFQIQQKRLDDTYRLYIPEN
jgi:hypothetical protein